MNDLYDKIKENGAFWRRAEKCGFGFELPSAAMVENRTTTHQPSQADLNEAAAVDACACS